MSVSVTEDYQRAASFLDRTPLPAYVSFEYHMSARGVGSPENDDQRIYVRISDGKIVSGVPPNSSSVIRTTNGDSNDPFRNGGFFNPHCYQPKNEEKAHWNGQPALRFELQTLCADSNGINELYVDPKTYRLISVNGVVPDPDNNVKTAIEMQFATIAEYTVPTGIEAHTVGHGLLFWVRERVEVDYAAYQFYTYEEFMRRQASKTIGEASLKNFVSNRGIGQSMSS